MNLYAVDADTSNQQWAFETGGRVLSSPTVADETVFVGSDDTNVYAVDANTGEQQWVFEDPFTSIRSSPTVVNGTVIVGSEESTIFALDAATGEKKWAYDTGGAFQSSPTVVDGTVYVGSTNAQLYAINADVSGSSSGSRERLRTLGHYNESQTVVMTALAGASTLAGVYGVYRWKTTNSGESAEGELQSTSTKATSRMESTGEGNADPVETMSLECPGCGVKIESDHLVGDLCPACEDGYLSASGGSIDFTDIES